jgi:hypothetical protein
VSDRAVAFDSWATYRSRCWARWILPEGLGFGMLAKSDVHVLVRGVSGVGDPTAEGSLAEQSRWRYE